MENIELRVIPTTFVSTDEDMVVEGLVNATEKLSHTLGYRTKFKEKISKGAFSKALEKNKNIDFLAEHDTRMLLASTSNESLQLFEDEEGLKMRARIAPTSYGKDMYTLMKSGLVGNMSFGFRALSDKWKKSEDGILERTVDELELFEVSVVKNPAYPQSVISARGINVVEDVDVPQEIEEQKQEEVVENKEVVVDETRELVVAVKELIDVIQRSKEQPKETKSEDDDVVQKNEEIQEDEVEEESEKRDFDLSAYYDRANKLKK